MQFRAWQGVGGWGGCSQFGDTTYWCSLNVSHVCVFVGFFVMLCTAVYLTLLNDSVLNLDSFKEKSFLPLALLLDCLACGMVFPSTGSPRPET